MSPRAADSAVGLYWGNVEWVVVALRSCRGGAAVGGFGGEMTSHKPVSRTRETAVGEQSDGIAETSAHQGSRNAQHFTHAGAAFRPLIANDDHGAGLDEVLFDGRKSRFLVFKHASVADEILQG